MKWLALIIAVVCICTTALILAGHGNAVLVGLIVCCLFLTM